MGNIYQRLGLRNGSSIEEVKERMEKYRRLSERNNDIKSAETFKKIEKEYAEFAKDKKAYDEARGFNVFENKEIGPDILIKGRYDDRNYDILLRDYDILLNPTNNVNSSNSLNVYNAKKPCYKLYGEKKNKKRAKIDRKKLVPKIIKFIAFGCVLVYATSLVSDKVDKQKKEDLQNNVCLEYKVQKGDTYNKLEDMFKDYSIIYREVTGPYRNITFVYAGDIVIGRTTMEVAQKLVDEGYARIISVEEAVERLEESESLHGEFKKYAQNESDVVFIEPIKHII